MLFTMRSEAAHIGAAAERPLVSIISSVHNVEHYVAEAIRSVLAQTYDRWELLIGCDGCTDGTEAIVCSFHDPRIMVFVLAKQGLSATRNHLLAHARGEFLCMLDGDDVMPPRSVEARATVLIRDRNVSFADGAVEFRNADLSRIVGYYRPRLRGHPMPHLLAQDGSCFFGNTWMIRREPALSYYFDPELTHGEDLLFYISIAEGRLYDHTDEVVLWYRRTGGTLMSNLEGLEKSYALMFHKIQGLQHMRLAQRWRFKLRIMQFMALAYLKFDRSPVRAIRVCLRYLRL